MKVKTLITFKDTKAKKLRKAGEIFECTESRYAEILKVGKLVEPVATEEVTEEQPKVKAAKK